MSATELQFRTAAFGGFQKQDVLDYIESSSREHGEKLDSLKRELDESLQARAALEDELAAARERAGELIAANGALEAAREELTTAQTQAAGEVEDLRTQVERERARAEEAETALAAVRAELERARPAAEAYENLKDRTAGIELEAHCRAQGVEAEAEERVKRTREQVEQWLGRLKAEYDRLRTDLDATLSHVGGELGQAEHILEDISGVLARQDGTLEALTGDCMADLGPKAPTPLPLDE